MSRPVRLQGRICDDVVETTASDLGGFLNEVLLELVNEDIIGCRKDL